MKRIVPWLFAMLLLSGITAAPAHAQELCQITGHDGTIYYGPCCKIPDGSSYAADVCSTASKALDKEEIEALERVLLNMKTKRVVQTLRRNPSLPLIGFQIAGQVLELFPICCECSDGEGGACSFNCEPPDSNGICPAGFPIRVLCSSADCTEID